MKGGERTEGRGKQKLSEMRARKYKNLPQPWPGHTTDAHTTDGTCNARGGNCEGGTRGSKGRRGAGRHTSRWKEGSCAGRAPNDVGGDSTASGLL